MKWLIVCFLTCAGGIAHAQSYPGFTIDGRLRNDSSATRRNIQSALNDGRVNPRDYVDQSQSGGGPIISEDTDIGDGSTDARGAFAAADAGENALAISPGTYLIGSDVTLSNCVCPSPGAVIMPDIGVTITLSGGYAAEDMQQVFNTSLGGTIVVDERSYITPQHWGAKGGGVNTDDDSPMIQAAIDAALNAELELYVPAGLYYLGSTLSIDCSAADQTITMRGAGILKTRFFAMNALNGPIIQSSGAFQVAWSSFSDMYLAGSKPGGLRVNIVADFHSIEHCTFTRIYFVAAYRVAFLLGTNWSNSFNRCIFQAGAITGNDNWHTFGLVTTSGNNNANIFTSCTFIKNTVGYYCASGGNENAFFQCTFEGNRICGAFLNGSKGWQFSGTYLEANGESIEPHQWWTANVVTPLASPWLSKANFILSGSPTTLATAVNTTTSTTNGSPTLTVVDATGLVLGAKVEVTGAGTSGAILYSRIIAVAGTTITLQDNCLATLADTAIEQPIQLSTDLAASGQCSGISITGTLWSPSIGGGDFVTAAVVTNATIQHPGYGAFGASSLIAEGTLKLINTYGSNNAISDITYANGRGLPRDGRHLRVTAPNLANNPGQSLLAPTASWPWASEDVVQPPYSGFAISGSGTWEASTYSHQGTTLQKLEVVSGNATAAGTAIVDLGQYPELVGKWVVLEVDHYTVYDAWDDNDAFYNGGLWLYADSADGFHSSSGGVATRPVDDILTTGSLASGATALTVASEVGLFTGRVVNIEGAGASGGNLVCQITAISGTAITVDTAAGTTVTDVNVLQPALITTSKTFTIKTNDQLMDIWLRAYVNSGGVGNQILIDDIRVREIGNLIE